MNHIRKVFLPSRAGPSINSRVYDSYTKNRKRPILSKSKKVFNTEKFGQAKKGESNPNQISPTSYSKVACIIIIVLLIIIMLCNQVHVAVSDYERTYLLKKNAAIALATDRAYDVLCSSAYRNLKENNKRIAYEDYRQALTLKPDGIIALIGFTKTLIKYCAEEGIYCKSTKDYLTYLEQQNIMTSEDLNELVSTP